MERDDLTEVGVDHDGVNRLKVLREIIEERLRQDRKYGEGRDLPIEVWVTILLAEMGEIGQAICKGDYANLEEELVQVAAVCVACLENIRRPGVSVVLEAMRGDDYATS